MPTACPHCGANPAYLGEPDEDGDRSCIVCSRPQSRHLEIVTYWQDHIEEHPHTGRGRRKGVAAHNRTA